MKRLFRHSLRFKLLTLSLSLLVIPWAGYRFIQDMESILRETQDGSLIASAKTLASRLQSERFPPATASSEAGAYPQPDIYVHQLDYRPQLDGYGDEWEYLRNDRARYRQTRGPDFDLLLGEFGDYLYLLLEAENPNGNYVNGPEIHFNESDQAVLAFTDSRQQMRHYLIAPRAPGWIAARRFDIRNPQQPPGETERQIQGQWQESARGYSLELRIAKTLVGQKLALSLYEQESGQTHATSDVRRAQPMGNLVRRSQPLQQLLQQINIPNSRISLTDRNGRVLAGYGRLTSDAASAVSQQQPAWIVRKLFSLILRHQAPDSPSLMATGSRLSPDYLQSALRGSPGISYHRAQNEDGLLVSVVYPVSDQQRVKGFLIIEQTTDAILSLQNNALQRLLAITLLVMTVIGLILLGYATLLTRRIRSLLHHVEQAVTADGRIIGELKNTDSADEIGDLGRGFSQVLSRLSGYNDYLEQMASRLTHELRTPITVVRTSLESGLQVDHGAGEKYLHRALQGTARLDLLVTQLAEATRLERSFDQMEKRPVDLNALLQANLEIFSAGYPQERFELVTTAQATKAMAAAELITQALEKLIGNAVDFRTPGTAIQIKLSETASAITLSVCNEGHPLPDGVDPFRSMVSIRKQKDTTPHLGLGLYLVRLIAQFHQGQARAYNQRNGRGVCVEFSLIKGN